MLKRKNIPIFTICILILFLSINDFFGLIEFHDLIGKGELYDFTFIGFMIVFFTFAIKAKTPLHFAPSQWLPLIPFIILILYCVISGCVLVLQGGQSLIQTAFVLRELFYLFIFLPFAILPYDTNNLCKLLIIFDSIGCCIYIIEVFTGPLLSTHVAGKTQLGLYRFYSDNPMFVYFLAPLLIYAILQKRYIFSKIWDGIFLFFFILTMLLRFSKMAFATLLFVCTLAFLTGSITSIKVFGKRIIILISIVVSSILLINFFAPQLLQFFLQGIQGLAHITDVDIIKNGTTNPAAGSISYRSRTILLRYKFLHEQGKILFGMGPLHNASTVFCDIYDSANKGIIASDIAYGAILIRYGIIGIIGFITSYLTLAGTMLKKANILSKSLGLYCIAMIIAAVCGHSYLCFSAFLKLGILIGIVYKNDIK